MFSQYEFALLADETRNVSNREQLVLGIRWVSDSSEINEDMVGLIQLNYTTAATIHKCLKDSLVGLGFQFQNCGNKLMTVLAIFRDMFLDWGKGSSMTTLLLFLHVHFLAHCVNLCLQEVARKVHSIKEGINFAMGVIQLIKLSPKRQLVFGSIQKQQDSPNSFIRPLCPTWWTVHTWAMQAIAMNYETLQSEMEVSSHGTHDCWWCAGGVLTVMVSCSTLFGLKFCFLIFSMIEQLSVTLGSINTTVNDCY